MGSWGLTRGLVFWKGWSNRLGGGLTALGLPGEGSDFAGFSSVSLFALIRGVFRLNLGLFSCCLLGVLAWSSLLGTGG
jgi:hypothetical protein